MQNARPRHVRVSVAEFELAPEVSLEAWGLLLWIGRFRAERWPSCVVRVADLQATGASIRRLRRLLEELWNAGLVTLVDDDAEAALELLTGDDEEAASKAAEAIDARVRGGEIGKVWRIISEMLAEDSPNLSAIERTRLLNRERQRRHRFRQKMKKQLWLGLDNRIDHNAVTSRPSYLDHTPPTPPGGPAEIAAPAGASVSEVASGALGDRTLAVERNRPEKSLGGGGSHNPPGENENAAPRVSGEASKIWNGAGEVLAALRRS